MTGKATELIDHGYRAPEGFESPAVPVHKASTVFFRDVAHLRSQRWVDKSGYTYGLHGTPTSFMLEQRLATLEGARHVLLAPSGLSAITLVDQALLAPGDEMLLPDNVYAPSLNFARHELARWGITTRLYDPLDVASLRAAINPATRLLWLEAPGSVTLEFPDLRALVRTAREAGRPDLVLALDNTWGAGVAFNAFELGEGLAVDLTVHALTKYPSGGGDLLMGSVATRNDALHETLAWTHSRLGLGVGANDVEAVLRSLPSMPLRYAAQDAAARRIAQWCTQRSEIERVLHPALPGAPGHEHWAALCSAAAGLLTLEFKVAHTPQQVDAFVDALRRFRIGWSWGGPISLAVPYDAASMRSLGTPYLGRLVRLCIGLEDVDDLIEDLGQALGVLAGDAR
ncbi:PLP-dependent transferase [Rivibacter subsaxonicus]|uniref:Cystathionine beta-lyase n=1 Tax=Rivibacter subsaxonicus TaxID=457575 RepID=A0A4Q7VPC2_9BURK|nr:PLP-dependent transferase [Rivibacter subsaxonicus]RZT98209.1 cystathionine beta-lyase [Rivibacter subsaxonicus]